MTIQAIFIPWYLGCKSAWEIPPMKVLTPLPESDIYVFLLYIDHQFAWPCENDPGKLGACPDSLRNYQFSSQERRLGV